VTSRYQEWPVAGADRVIACRWHQHGAGQVQRVVPDGCADVIIFDGRGAVVVGPTAEVALPELAADTTVVGLRVRTEAIRAVFGLPGYELRDRDVPLDEVLGPLGARRLIDALLQPRATGNAWLCRWLVDSPARIDPRAAVAVRRLQGSGTADVATVAASVGLSGRQLRRVVEAETGLGPKTVQRIGRFQRFLRLADAGAARVGGPGSLLADWAVRAGYADQAHLTKDISELAATTPARLVAERAGVSGSPESQAAR